MNRRFLAVWLAAAAASAAFGTQVVNGGFENGLNNWIPVLDKIDPDLSLSPGAAHSGSAGIQFASNGYDGISQLIPTTSGLQYTLEFWVRNYGAGDDSLQIVWEGATVFDSTPLASPLEDWQLFSVPLSATQNGSTLLVRGSDAIAWIQVDDISLREVPEPGSLVLLTLGLLQFGRGRK